MDKREIITSIKKYISFLKENKLPVQRVYVFGSYAKGNMHDDSDIDLAIVLEYLENSVLTQYQLMRMRRDFDLRIEPHPFREEDFNSSNPFADEILSTGIRIV